MSMTIENEKCSYCDQMAIIILDAGELPLCAFHYINNEDDVCLITKLKEQIEEHGNITDDKSIQAQIKIQKPKIYLQLEPYFTL